jgi:hypothetical protein
MPNAAFLHVRLLALAAVVILGKDARADVLTYNLSNTPTAKGDTSTGVYNPLSLYSEPGGFGVAFLLPPVPIALPLGGGGASSAFMTALATSFPTKSGWSFTAAANNLAQNSLVVNADQVSGGKSYPCYHQPGDCVGILGTATTAGFAVSYTGPAIADAHWIQVINTNSPAAGQTSPYVDNDGSLLNPYYDVRGNATSTVFLDAPNRSPTDSQYWLGNLYYVSGNFFSGNQFSPSDVTIYNGLVWGWADIFVNTSNFAAFFAAVNSDLSSVASLDTALGADLTGVLDQTEVGLIDAEFDAAAVPEPRFVVVLLCGLFLISAGVKVFI